MPNTRTLGRSLTETGRTIKQLEQSRRPTACLSYSRRDVRSSGVHGVLAVRGSPAGTGQAHCRTLIPGSAPLVGTSLHNLSGGFEEAVAQAASRQGVGHHRKFGRDVQTHGGGPGQGHGHLRGGVPHQSSRMPLIAAVELLTTWSCCALGSLLARSFAWTASMSCPTAMRHGCGSGSARTASRKTPAASGPCGPIISSPPCSQYQRNHGLPR